MKQKLTIAFSLFMILFSTSIPGVYALEDVTGIQMPEMDAEQSKEMTLEIIDNSINSLTTLQSETEDEDLLDSIDSFLEQMESLKTELEVTGDEDEISAIMEEFRSSMEEGPDEVREVMMQNGPAGLERQGHMNGNRTLEGERPMNGDAPADIPNNDAADDEKDSGGTSEESTGLLSGLISMIKSLF